MTSNRQFPAVQANKMAPALDNGLQLPCQLLERWIASVKSVTQLSAFFCRAANHLTKLAIATAENEAVNCGLGLISVSQPHVVHILRVNIALHDRVSVFATIL